MKLNIDVVPKNLYECVKLILDALESDEEINAFKKPVGIHFGFGMWMRNNWGMWDKDSPLHQWFVNNIGVGHADDMSGLVLTAVQKKLNNEEFNLDEEKKLYIDYWKNLGYDAKTMQKLDKNGESDNEC